MAEAEEKQDRGFTVVDRRGAAGEAEAPAAAAESAGPEEIREETGELPKIDFATFVLSLGTSALYHLGIAPDPASGQRAPEPDLMLARQTIDTLEMIEAKTRGNLDREEAQLLEGVLYELRMRFVEASP